ncbi:multiple C2 and transmembrane domain-containing protein 1-like isoform X3 [Xyrauchen texanus]|uniref:multiple C2 and transmembrane domain-containing protein 1-like isoform X3 n=1 Tax=Xyrauchen texanus TaxID=154827 RepID=UPI0022429365|nr:multiple C2 and transmembrane domain-containing protein 1-like isoform X3 [Xyrauchen texanus]
MEGKLDMGDVSPSHQQHQQGMWKSLQGKSKLTSSPKLGKKERKQESVFRIFKKRKAYGLNRAISSSQPNLPSAAALESGSDGDESGKARCGMPEQSGRRAAAAAVSLGKETETLKRTMSAKPTVSHLVRSQHKPAQQGSTSTEGAVVDGKEEQVNKSMQQQNLRLSDLYKKSQLWRGIVSIHLIEGRDLIPMDQNGLSDPYVKFKLGHQKYKSKTIAKTLNPQWREQFDLHLFDEEGGVLEISVWDRDMGRRDDFIGQCKLDLSQLSKEKTHKVELELEEDKGTIVLLVTLTATVAVSISDMSVNILDVPHERRQILKRYSPLRSFFNLKDVGILQVKILRAEGLMAADVTGKSDPFCVAELCNDRLQTHTVYKTLNPEWNKVFTFNVKDIHSVLEVTVYDEDRDRSADFLGKVAIPLLNIRNSEQKAYVLKNKELTGPTKGVIFLEADVIFNGVRASLRTFKPPEQKYVEEECKVSKQLLQQNFNRVKRCVLFLINVGSYINSCFQWESPRRSICAFLIFVVVVWNFEIYMIPLSLLLLLTWNYFLLETGKEPREGGLQAMEDLLEDEEEDSDKDDKDSEKKGFLDKFYAIQDVIVSVQNALDEAASFGERVKNTFNWSVPFLSWLAITVLIAGATLIYFIPLRYILLVWGINKFTKKLRNPYLIDNNELMDFLSRVPSDVQMVQYKEFKLDSTQSPSKRRRNNP